MFICSFEELGNVVNFVLSCSKWNERRRPIYIFKVLHPYLEVVKNPPQAPFMLFLGPFSKAVLSCQRIGMNSYKCYWYSFIFVTYRSPKIIILRKEGTSYVCASLNFNVYLICHHVYQSEILLSPHSIFVDFVWISNSRYFPIHH